MPKPPPGGPAKPKPPVPDVAETTRLPPLEERPEPADETVEVTNPLAKMPARPEPGDTRVDKVSSRDDLRAAPTTDPSVDLTVPLPRIPEPTPPPEPQPVAAATRVEGLPNRSSREQPAVPGEDAGPASAGEDLSRSKPVDVARRATVLKINPETIQSWMDDGSGEHKAVPGNGPRPLIEDLKEELEAESKKHGERSEASAEPGKPAPLPLRPSSERNPRQNVADVSTAPKVVLRERSSFRDRAKRMSNTLSMLLKQEAARRRRGFLYGVLTVGFAAAVGYFGYVYVWPLLEPLLPTLLKR